MRVPTHLENDIRNFVYAMLDEEQNRVPEWVVERRENRERQEARRQEKAKAFRTLRRDQYADNMDDMIGNFFNGL